MFMIVIVVVAVACVPLTGGSLRNLSRIQLRHGWLIFLGLGMQLVITTVLPDLPAGPSRLVHLVSYVFVIAFLVTNRRTSGMKLVILGTLLNFAAIAANAGTMPADPVAVKAAGIVTTHDFENSAPVRHARLQFLGDDFDIPARWPLSNVFSIGDVVILTGALVLVFGTARSGQAADSDDSESSSRTRGTTSVP